MEFQRYSKDHQEALIRLHRSALVGISHGYSQEKEESDIRSIDSEYIMNGGEFLIGFMEGQLVAMGGFRIIGDGVAELKRMRIAPELQGQGIGSALLDRLEELAREKKLRKLVLDTAASRQKTLSFYRRHGYVLLGKGMYGTQATVCFEKVLEELPNHSAIEDRAKMVTISDASTKDADAILVLQKLAYQSEAKLYNDWSLPPLTQSIESLLEEFTKSIVLKATLGDRLIGSVRAMQNGGKCTVGRLIVHPELQGQGIGSKLLRSIEERFKGVSKFELFTGSRSEANIRLYQRHGYTIVRTQPLSQTVSITFLEKWTKDFL